MRNLLIILAFCLSGCKKENVLDSAPSLVGHWKHFSAAEDWHIIRINEDGNGTMEWYIGGKLYRDTKARPWMMKDNTLYFGKAAFNGELYEVEEYPAKSGSESVVNFDTLKIGARFINLDGNYYVEF